MFCVLLLYFSELLKSINPICYCFSNELQKLLTDFTHIVNKIQLQYPTKNDLTIIQNSVGIYNQILIKFNSEFLIQMYIIII